MRSPTQSLYTTILAAADIGLGSVLHQSLSVPFGLLLIGVGVLVLVAGGAELLFGYRTAYSGELDHITESVTHD
jgi:uncharacterized membrane protein